MGLAALLRLFGWIMSFWESLPPGVKEQCIDTAVASFDHIFRALYKKAMQDRTANAQP